MNSIELEVEMKRYGDTGESLAKALHISAPTFSAKKNGIKAEFTQKEIAFITDRYNLSGDRVLEIFFAKTVS